VFAAAVLAVVAVVGWGYYGSIPVISPLVHGEKFLTMISNSMLPTIRQGATLAYDNKVPFSDLKVSDIIVFTRPGENLFAFGRIIGIAPDGLQVKGDGYQSPYPWNITESLYVGKIVRVDNPL
jgi:hypothetical protein